MRSARDVAFAIEMDGEDYRGGRAWAQGEESGSAKSGSSARTRREPLLQLTVEQVVGQSLRIEGRPFEIMGRVERLGKFRVSRLNVC